jgi:hypothetical protein
VWTGDDVTLPIHVEEWKCTGCKTLVYFEEVVWANKDGTLSTDTGDPYCVGCVPDEVPTASRPKE